MPSRGRSHQNENQKRRYKCRLSQVLGRTGMVKNWKFKFQPTGSLGPSTGVPEARLSTPPMLPHLTTTITDNVLLSHITKTRKIVKLIQDTPLKATIQNLTPVWLPARTWPMHLTLSAPLPPSNQVSKVLMVFIMKCELNHSQLTLWLPS